MSVIPCEIRRAEPGDLGAIVALCAEHAEFERVPFSGAGKRERLEQAIFGDVRRLHAWVAVVQAQAAGYATASVEFSTWNAAPYLHMDCLYVRAGLRNVGIGLALLGAVRSFAREERLAEVQWQTPAWNTEACRYYRRHGAIGLPKARFSLAA